MPLAVVETGLFARSSLRLALVGLEEDGVAVIGAGRACKGCEDGGMG